MCNIIIVQERKGVEFCFLIRYYVSTKVSVTANENSGFVVIHI